MSSLVRYSRFDDAMRRTLRWTLYAVLFTPLIFKQTFIYAFIVVKVFTFQALIGVAMAVWLVLLVRGAVPRPRLTPLRTAMLVFLGVLLLVSLLGVDPARSLWSTQERSLGVIAIAHFVAFAFLIAESFDTNERRRYFVVSAIVSIIAALFTFVQFADPSLFLEQSIDRPGSFLGNPTFLAAYLLPHIFLMLWLGSTAWSERKSTWGSALWGSAALMEIVVVIFVTQTRGAILGLVAGIVVLAGIILWRGRDVRISGRYTLRHAAMAGLAAVFAVGVLFVSTQQHPFWRSVPGLSRLVGLSLASQDIQPRLIALGITRDIFMDRPILGYGFENFKYPFDARYEPILLRHGFSETYFDKPHNIIAEYVVSGGIAGLLAFLYLFWSFFWVLFTRRELSFLAPFGAALIVAHIVNNVFVFDTFGSYLALFLFAGLIDQGSAGARGQSAPAGPLRSGERSAFVWALTVVFLVFGVLWAVLNASILKANNSQYWALNYLVQSHIQEADRSYEEAIGAWMNPYADTARKDYSSAVTRIYLQNVPATPEMVRRSMETLLAVIKNKPNDYFLRVNYADAATAIARLDPSYLDEAERQLAEALRLSPRRQQIYYALAKVLISQGRIAEALKAAEDAIELDPQIGDSHFYLGLIAFEAENVDLGFREIEIAASLKRVPRTGDEMRVVANRYADAGNYPKAIELYLQAIKKNPKDIEAKVKLGIVYHYAGDIDAARVILSEVVAAVDLRGSASYDLLKPIFDAVGVSMER